MWLYHNRDDKDKLKKSEHGGSKFMDAEALGSTLVVVNSWMLRGWDPRTRW